MSNESLPINQIYLGDAYELIKGIPDNSVDLIVTDPPYQIGGLHGAGVVKGRAYNKEMIDADLGKGIDLSILDEFVRVMKKINIYLWCNKEQIYDYLTFFVKERGCNWEMLVWAKQNPPPFYSTHWLKDKEYCLYFWEKASDVLKIEDLESARTVFFSTVNKSDRDMYGHPTIKPETIIEVLIRNSSVRGGVILDPFAGSGTTPAAAKRLERDYIGFEISPQFHKIAVDRLNGITQKERKANAIQEKLF